MQPYACIPSIPTFYSKETWPNLNVFTLRCLTVAFLVCLLVLYQLNYFHREVIRGLKQPFLFCSDNPLGIHVYIYYVGNQHETVLHSCTIYRRYHHVTYMASMQFIMMHVAIPDRIWNSQWNIFNQWRSSSTYMIQIIWASFFVLSTCLSIAIQVPHALMLQSNIVQYLYASCSICMQ